MNTPPTPEQEREHLLRRAQAAYFRTRSVRYPPQPSETASSVVEHEGRTYVVLRNDYETLAVYRVMNSGALKRLKRPPRSLAPDWFEEAS